MEKKAAIAPRKAVANGGHSNRSPLSNISEPAVGYKRPLALQPQQHPRGKENWVPRAAQQPVPSKPPSPSQRLATVLEQKRWKRFPYNRNLECTIDAQVRKVNTTTSYGNSIDEHGGQLWVRFNKLKLKRCNIVAATWHVDKDKLQLGPGGLCNDGAHRPSESTFRVFYKDGNYKNCALENLVISTTALMNC